jgi:hypothetical protein
VVSPGIPVSSSNKTDFHCFIVKNGIKIQTHLQIYEHQQILWVFLSIHIREQHKIKFIEKLFSFQCMNV